ncbi:MAG: GntP family permease [Coriobacteriaceae bacterium]|nr:GntP family permease [Coriobacteriaceae bacterium]
MDDGIRMLLALIVGLVALVLLITKTKVHVFLAVILCSIFIGLAGGMAVDDTMDAITQGFGNSLSSIGIIIGFGVMLGKLLEISGATNVMANTFIKLFGKDREPEALALSGFVTSLSIFCTSGFIILAPLMKALSRRSAKSVATLGIALAVGLVASHSLVPPAAGPIGVAGILNVNIGTFMLYGTIVSIPLIIAGVIYAKWLGDRIYQVPTGDEGWTRDRAVADAQARELSGEGTSDIAQLAAPRLSAPLCFAPILSAILLILLKTVLAQAGISTPVTDLAGQPVFALALGLLVAIFGLTRSFSTAETLGAMEEGLKASGKLMLLVGAGGALGRIIQVSGLGDYIASSIVATPIPPILLPFLIALLLRVAQGSGSVAMMTAASVVAPMVGALGLDPALAALAACVGAIPFSHFNDSYFWVINETIGVDDTSEQMRVWSVTTTLVGFVALATLIVMDIFI